MNKLINDYKIDCDKNKRIEYIDLLRSIGILLMIMGHIGFGDIFDKEIHVFHMPLFFIISGYFYRNKYSFSKYLLHKTKALLIPYFFTGILHLFIVCIIQRRFVYESLYSLMWENTNGYLPIAGALWFLSALYITEIIYFFVSKVDENIIKNIIIVLISLIGMIIPK